MNKKPVEGQFLLVNRHIPKKENEPQHGSRLNPITQNLTRTFNSNIYVKFIPNDVTEDRLREVFAVKDSNIVSIKLTQSVKKVNDIEIKPYQFAFILYDTVQGAQKAIQTFDNSTVLGPKPLFVELWVSKEEKEQERKRKENQQIHQFINSIMNLNRVNSFPPNQQYGGAQVPGGPMPQGNMGYQGGQGGRGGYNNRGRGGPHRGGRGEYRGGNRGGHPQGGHQNYAPRSQPPVMGIPQAAGFPPQQPPFGMMPGQMPP